MINRRKFVAATAASAAGLILGSRSLGSAPGKKTGSFDLMKEALKYRKIDCHIHLALSPGVTEDLLLDFADRLGIEKMVISRPMINMVTTQQDVIDSNNMMIDAMKRNPDRFIAQFTLNPLFPKESLEEIKRCTGLGAIGLKLYYQVKLNDPLCFPIIEKMTDLKMITLMHSFNALGRGGYRTKYGNLYPNETTADDFVDVAKRYPDTMLQFAHIGGGSDWEYECKTLKDYPNIYIDVSGSNNEENIIDYALKYISEDRLLYGSDNSYFQGVSKLLSANLTEVQRKKIFFDNYKSILKRGGYNVG
jgi:predicted TIM-barrel fold metal-dependent hydrolase